MTSLNCFLLPILMTLILALHPQSTHGYDNIFILAGQSNMVGAGGVYNSYWDGKVPSECQPDRSRIFRFNYNYAWEVATEPLHGFGVGPGMPFANAIKHRVAGSIGLVPCAVGGTPISTWQRGQKHYEDMISRAKAALASGGAIKAMLWYQGEEDTKSWEQVNSYQQRMVDLFTSVREDLNVPNLPIIQVAITSGSSTYMESIRSLQKGLQMASVSYVDAKGLEMFDGVHLTTAAQVNLGAMLAEEYVSKYA